MAKFYAVPFTDRRLLGNLEKLLPQESAENCVAYYDSTIFDNKDMGLLLTKERLIQFARRNITQAVRLESIGSIRAERQDDSTYSLVIDADGATVQQNFPDSDLLRAWLLTLQQYTTVEVPVLAPKRDLHHQEYQSAATDENHLSFLRKRLFLAPQECYLAYAASARAGNHPLLLTSRRLVRLNDGYIEWSVWLNRIESLEAQGRTIVVFERGKRYAANLEDQPGAEAFEALIKARLEASEAT